MITTGQFTKQWTALHSELSPERLGRERLAGLFLGHRPEKYEDQDKRVFLFGKSTAGEFAEDDAHERFFNGTSSFWHFARQLSRIAGGDGGSLSNLAWSNVCKIGVVKGNPGMSLQLAQWELACRTLAYEVDIWRPHLAVFVSEGFADQIVYDAFGITKGANNDFETKSSDNGDFYYRERIAGGTPAMLWVQHPQGKQSARTDEWLAEAEILLND